MKRVRGKDYNSETKKLYWRACIWASVVWILFLLLVDYYMSHTHDMTFLDGSCTYNILHICLYLSTPVGWILFLIQREYRTK